MLNLMAFEASAALHRSVVIADDDVLLREGLASLLDRHGFTVAGLADDGDHLLELVEQKTPDLAVVDIRMPPTHTTEGLAAAREVRRRFPSVAILVLSAFVEVEHAIELLASGERIGYLLKSRVTDVDDFVETLHRVHDGGTVVDPAVVQELVAAHRRRDPLDVLSPREREVLALLAEGKSNKEISVAMNISVRTVEAHRLQLMEKLNIRSVAELTKYAIREGITSLDM